MSAAPKRKEPGARGRAQADLDRRYATNRSGKVTVGGCILMERSNRFSDRRFSLGIMRLREIEKLITSRHGKTVPETDDADAYMRAVALSCSGQDLGEWCRRWAPWAVGRLDLIEKLEEEEAGRRKMLRADAVAALLHVTFAEREELGLATIGACDVSSATRKRIVRRRKRDRDRQRQEERRRQAGTKAREEYLKASISAVKPWEAQGISRAVWYRRRRETSPSRLEYIRKGDGPVSPAVEGFPLTPSPDRKAGGPGSGPKALMGVQRAKPLGVENQSTNHPIARRTAS